VREHDVLGHALGDGRGRGDLGIGDERLERDRVERELERRGRVRVDEPLEKRQGNLLPGEPAARRAGVVAIEASVTVAVALTGVCVISAAASATATPTAAASSTTRGSTCVPSRRPRTPVAARPIGSGSLRPTDHARSTSAATSARRPRDAYGMRSRVPSTSRTAVPAL
jgi:hypothetical protein